MLVSFRFGKVTELLETKNLQSLSPSFSLFCIVDLQFYQDDIKSRTEYFVVGCICLVISLCHDNYKRPKADFCQKLT